MNTIPGIAAPVIVSATLTQAPDGEKKGKAEKKSGKRIGYNYIIIKSLKESQKNDVVKCLYIKSLVNFGICVIKEGTYGDTKDKEGRDIKDRLIWQKKLHERLHGKIRLPRLLGSFEENGNYYLVLERIKGIPLYKACRDNKKKLREALITGNKLGRTFLNYILQLISLLESLHNEKVVHRDVTSSNFMITPAGRVAIIDMELSYSVAEQFPSPPFKLGTYGYMSPQQERTEMPDPAEDIFSLGAILLEIWTCISPGKLTVGTIEETTRKVYFFVPDKTFADIIISCLHLQPEMRPGLQEIRSVIEEYKTDIRQKNIRSLSKPFIFSKEELSETIQRSIDALSSPLLADEKRGWFAEDMSKINDGEKNKIEKAWYTSFDKGAAGVIYMLSKAKKSGYDTFAASPHVQNGLKLIEEKYINRINDASPSLYFGSSGIAVSLASAIREKLIAPQKDHFDWISKLIAVDNEQENFVDGIAGQGMAHWACDPFLHEEDMQQRLNGYVVRLIGNQQKDGCWLNYKKNNKKATKGFMRGTAGIIYFLLEYAIQYQDRDALSSAQRGLHWLIKKGVREGNTIRWKSSSNNEIAPTLSEGAPGISLAFIKAYSLLRDPIYKKYAEGALLTNSKNIIDNSLGQGVGLSGLGEIYLEAFKVLQQGEWMERAGWIAQVLMQMKKEHKNYGPYWLIGHERQPVSDFMDGNSGLIHFLLRYLHPDKTTFPMHIK